MTPYFKTFEIRWSELDANYHVANFAYIQFMNEVRISYMNDNGVDINETKGKMGPVVFHEHFYYVKEILAYETVTVDIQMKGHSDDYRFLQFAHHLYKANGEIGAYSELMFAWMDLETRKLTVPTPNLIAKYDEMQKTDDFKILTSSDTRASGVPYSKKLELSNS